MRHRKRSNIIIELTPLLDVIMILIFIIMTNNSNKVIEAEAATDRAKTNAAKAAKEYESIISQKDMEYSSALEELNAELENVRVSAEENEAAKDAEIAKLKEGLTLAEAKVDSIEYLSELINTKAAQIDGYESLIKVVKVININLRVTYPNPELSNEEFERLQFESGFFAETLSYEYSGNIPDNKGSKTITTYVTRTASGINPNAAKENAASLEQNKMILSSFLNTCINDYLQTEGDAEDSPALYIVFTCKKFTNGSNSDMIDSVINKYKDMYPDHNITYLRYDSNIDINN